jgi:phage terminase large subunit-like protein
VEHELHLDPSASAVCRRSSTACPCPDWEQRIVERRSLVPFDPLFPDEAEAALEVFKSLRMVDVPGRPTFGEACEPFVFDFVGRSSAPTTPDTGQRLISEFMLLISKKNGKSTIAAGIMLTALIRNWRDSAELIILAPTQEVAGNSFKPAAAMVRADPKLLRDAQGRRPPADDPAPGDRRRAQGGRGRQRDAGGKKAGFVLVDELWLFGKRPNAEAMFEEATGGLASRPEGFVVYLTTHSDEPPAGVFKDKLDYFRDVRDGEIDDPSCFGMLYEWPEAMLEDAGLSEAREFLRHQPEPRALGHRDFISGKLRKARAARRTRTATPAASRWCWPSISTSRSASAAARPLARRGLLGGCGRPTLTLEALLERCEVVVVGADGGGLDDLYGLCVAGRERGPSAGSTGSGRGRGPTCCSAEEHRGDAAEFEKPTATWCSARRRRRRAGDEGADVCGAAGHSRDRRDHRAGEGERAAAREGGDRPRSAGRQRPGRRARQDRPRRPAGGRGRPGLPADVGDRRPGAEAEVRRRGPQRIADDGVVREQRQGRAGAGRPS